MRTVMKRSTSSFRLSWRSISLTAGGRGVEAEQDVMALAVLLDPVGEAAQAPIFALFDSAAIGFELGGDGIGDGVGLCLRDLAPCDHHGFI